MDDFVKDIKRGIENAIKKQIKRHNIDESYFGIKVDVTEYDSSFHKWKEYTIIDTNEKLYCSFCGGETCFADRDGIYWCAKCYANKNE